jgi:hypothetical protein
MTFYVSAKMDVKLADYVYRDFTEAVSGVWVPLTHEVSFWKADSEFTETVKVDRFVANKPVAESLFIASSFFSKNIDFVDEFAKIYPE